MTKIIWMSDPHFQKQGTIDGLDPRLRLAAAIDHINAHHADAEFAVLSGDLVGEETEDDYSELAQYLARSAIPVWPMVGNNDERAGFRAHLNLPETAMPGFIQYRLDLPEAVILCLDTHLPGSHAGEICETRRNWLRASLSSTDKPVCIFMHHPPHRLRLPRQDEIRLQDGEVFLNLLAEYDNIRHLFIGHVHRPTCGTIRGIPFATLGALSFQAPPPEPDWEWKDFTPPQEPPHYAVLHLENGDVTLQYTQFCNWDHGWTSPTN